MDRQTRKTINEALVLMGKKLTDLTAGEISLLLSNADADHTDLFGMSKRAVFERMFAGKFDFTRSTTNTYYVNEHVEMFFVNWRWIFKIVLREHMNTRRKVLRELAVHSQMDPVGPFILGTVKTPTKTQFSNNPFKHSSLEDAKAERSRLKKMYGLPVEIYCRVGRAE